MKQSLRKIAREKRSCLACDVLSQKIKLNLFSTDMYKKAKNILCYYSTGSEVSTIDFFLDKTKNWYLPRIQGENLLVCPMQVGKLIENKYKILEPETIPVDDLEIIDLVIIPALCADRNGYRIGYGKGYYDRFLRRLPSSCCKIILTYSDLFYESVCPDEFDEKSDYVITDESIYKI